MVLDSWSSETGNVTVTARVIVQASPLGYNPEEDLDIT